MKKDFKGKSKFKGKKNGSNSSKGKVTDKEFSKGSGDKSTSSCTYDNDSLWYAMSEQLLKQIDSWSFDDVIGLPTRVYRHYDDIAPERTGVPYGAIMRIELLPTVGGADDNISTYNNKSPIVAACQRTYSILSASNGKTTKYLPEDIGLVILMLGNIISNVSVYWRLVGIRNLFSPRNRYVPNTLIEAMGFNPNNFLKNIANSMERFDNIIARLDGISMFADIDYFRKCDEIYAHLFFDKGSAMGQYYITKPAGWFRYTDGDIDPSTGFFTGNKLHYNEWAGLLEINDFLDILEDQVDDMLTSELFNLVYSDVIREIRRNGGSVYQFSTVDRNYQILPEFSEVFMTQVHNMTWGWIKDISNYEITDDVDHLDLISNLDMSMDPTADSNDRAFLGDQVVDFPYTDDPDYNLVAEALAYKSMGDYLITTGNAAGTVLVRALPDHAVYKVSVYCKGVDDSSAWRVLPYTPTYTEIADDVSRGLDSFAVQPLRVCNDATYHRAFTFGELNYWTTITATKMSRVFEQAFLKLFSPKFTQSLPSDSNRK